MSELTIVIPARGDVLPDGTLRHELFLQQTVADVCQKAKGDVTIYPVLDGYTLPESALVRDPRVTYLYMPPAPEMKKRQIINKVIAETTGRFVMSLDAHCMMAEGFDVALAASHQEGVVQIPRRNRLDAENWCIQKQQDGRPPIDYEHTMWPLKFDKPGLHGFRWDARTYERATLEIDETMHFQGSCWFMERTWFERLGLMQVAGYTGWGQEAEEIGLKTWRAGGQVLTNKRTWYAHLHKGAKYGRMYHMDKRSVDACNAYSFDYWVHKQRAVFERFIAKFWPVPGWPANWQEQLYGRRSNGGVLHG